MIRVLYVKSLLSAALVTALLAFGGCKEALAQQDTGARLNRLENEIQTLSRAVFRGEAPPADYTAVSDYDASLQADLELRLSQLEMELRTLTGQMEQQNFEIRRTRETVDRMLADLETRVGELERKFGTNSSGAPKKQENTSAPEQSQFDLQGYTTDTIISAHALEPTDRSRSGIAVSTLDAPSENGFGAQNMNADGTVGQPGTLPANEMGKVTAFEGFKDESPAAAYEEAFTLLREKNYAPAEQAFTAFLERYPGHTLAANAKYWLGETFYVRGQFERAAREFAEAYQKFPKGAKGPDSLLKLGMSLAGMGKKDEACLSFVQLRREYSKGAGPVLIRADQEAQRLGCE